jgi:aryl sulfotransferase
LQNHEQGFTPEFRANMGVLAGAMAAEQGVAPAAPPPPAPENPRDYLVQWFGDLEAQLDNPRNPASTRFGLGFFDFEETYWRERQRPNLLLVHYNDLKQDLAGEMQRIADFLDIKVPQSVMPSLVEAASFESMKKAGDTLIPNLKGVFDKGAERFINKGKSGRWRECLTAGDIARYEAIMARACSPGLAGWLEGGRRNAGDPKASPE